MTSRQVVGLVLAAGEGRRLGRPKALVETDGQSWLVRAVRALRDGGVSDVRVVVGAAASEVAALVPDGCRVLEAVDWREGMGASLRAGLAEVARADTELADTQLTDTETADVGAEQPSADAVIVMLVDTLGVSAEVVRRLSALAAPDVLARAAYDGQAGHPVLLGRDHWEGVAELARGDEGARGYLRSRPVTLVECSDLGTGEDIDTSEQLAAHHRDAGDVAPRRQSSPDTPPERGQN